MKQDRTNGLAMLHVHYKFNIDEIIDRFAKEYPRRMKLIDILNEDPIDSLPSIWPNSRNQVTFDSSEVHAFSKVLYEQVKSRILSSYN